MTDELGSEILDQLWSHVQTLNDLWVSGKADQLDPYFHEEAVVLHFDYKTRIRGRDAVIASYREFSQDSVVHSFRQFKPVIDVFGDTAVVTYAFAIDYEMGDQMYHESGRDMFVFLQENGKWLAVWRTMLPDPPATSDTADIFVE